MALDFSCRCGDKLRAPDDQALFTVVRTHADEKHPEMSMTDDQIRQGIQMMAKEVA